MLRDKTGSHISGKVSNGLLAGLLWTLENEICSFKLACIQSCEYIYICKTMIRVSNIAAAYDLYTCICYGCIFG